MTDPDKNDLAKRLETLLSETEKLYGEVTRLAGKLAEVHRTGEGRDPERIKLIKRDVELGNNMKSIIYRARRCFQHIAFYFSRDSAVLDQLEHAAKEWERNRLVGSPRTNLSFLIHIKHLICDARLRLGVPTAATQKGTPGRKPKYSHTRIEALRAKSRGESNKKCAAIFYETPYPTTQQIKNMHTHLIKWVKTHPDTALAEAKDDFPLLEFVRSLIGEPTSRRPKN